jgi:hypothetical protein
MTLSIVTLRSASPEEWDSIWKECDYSTYFHSREWAEIWMAYTRGAMKPYPKLIVFSDGKKALIPLSYQKLLRRLFRQYLSSPAGTFGGWISNDPLETGHAILLARWMIEGLGNLVWRLNPYDVNVSRISIDVLQDDVTHSLCLTGGFDSLFSNWTKGHKSAVTKAIRENVIVRIGSTEEDWRSYYTIYKASIDRWGARTSSKYAWGIFDEIFRRNSHRIRLWLSVFQNKVVAGAICFYAKKHVVYWHGAALEEFFPLRPVNLLMYTAIKHACEAGYQWFDFNPSGSHKGVKDFKKSFGAIPLPSPVVTRKTKLLSFVKKVSPILQRIWGYDLSLL